MYNINIPFAGDAEDVFIRSARLLGRTKEKKWLKMMVKNERFYINGDMFDSRENKIAFLRSLFKLVDALNALYKDDWDMHLFYVGEHYGKKRFCIAPMIRFKRFTITNSRNSSREIRDLIVVLPLKIGNITTYENNSYMPIYFDRPRGVKLTWQQDEYRSSYEHSHLHVKKPTNENIFVTTRFCVGDGEISEVSLLLQHEFDPNYFDLYLLTLDTLVKWESLEGTPYAYIDKITGKENATPQVQTMSIMNMHRIFNNNSYRFIYAEIKPNFVLHDNKFKILRDKTFESVIKRTLVSYEDYSAIVKKIGHDYISYVGQSAQKVTTERVVGDSFDEYTVISGEKIYFQIINSEHETVVEDINTYHVHPKFLNYVADKFEDAILKSSIRDCYVRPEDRVVDTQPGS